MAPCHTDDVTALAMNSDRTKVASGQVGLAPAVFIWNAETAEMLHNFKLPKGSRAVTAIGFSEDSSMIACADLSDKHNVYIYQISGASPKLLKTETSGPDKILHLAWNQAKGIDAAFCTVGPNHCCFWSPALETKKKKGNNKLTDEQGKPYATLNYACVTYNGKTAYTGGSKGEVIVWEGASAMLDPQIHTSVIHCIKFVKTLMNGEELEICITGSKDARIVLSNVKKNFEKIREMATTDTFARSVDMLGTKLLAGLRNGRIIYKELGRAEEVKDANKHNVLVYSHHEGEVWGLCEMAGSELFVTSGDDNKIIKWSVGKKQCLELCKIQAKPAEVAKSKKAGFKGGASTLSS